MVTSMLEKAIEIEGLLRIIRDGNPLPETYTVLNKKIAELAGQAAGLERRSITPEHDLAKADFVMTTADDEAQQPEVTFTEVPEHDLGLAEEDDIILDFDDQDITDTTDNELEISDTLESNPTEESAEEPAEEPARSPVEEAPEAPAEEPALPTPEAAPAPAPARQTKLKSAFSLNDRFLFARELFNGNMKMFDSTLEFLEGIQDYAMIEDYFYSELEWEPEKPYLAQFMEILRPYFKE